MSLIFWEAERWEHSSIAMISLVVMQILKIFLDMACNYFLKPNFDYFFHLFSLFNYSSKIDYLIRKFKANLFTIWASF